MSDNLYGDCRVQCASAIDFYPCLENCRDQPLVDLVAKHFGKEKGEACRGFSKTYDAAAWRLDPKFLADAQAMAARAPKGVQASALKYLTMPKAPYPPSPNTAPGGVLNSEPDQQAINEFIKSSPCYKYQLMAKAKDRFGMSGPESNLRGGLTTYGWVGLAGLAYAVWYFRGAK